MPHWLLAAWGGIVLVAAVSVGAGFIIRRREPVMKEADFTMRRRTIFSVIAGLTVLMIAESLNNLPSLQSQYDTAVPWSTFLTSQIFGVIATTVFFVLIVTGIWLATNALRRRLGIPAFPTGGSSMASNDAVVPGAALGSMAT